MLKELLTQVYGFFFAVFAFGEAEGGSSDTENGPGIDPDIS